MCSHLSYISHMQYEHCATAICVYLYLVLDILVVSGLPTIACYSGLWLLGSCCTLDTVVIALDRPYNSVFSKIIQLMS